MTYKGPDDDVGTLLQSLDIPASFRAFNEARENIKSVISGAVAVEHFLVAIIAHYFFGSSHEKKSEFHLTVLASDWCSFNAKLSLTLHIAKKVLTVGEVDKLEKLLRSVMTYRNAFAHGNFKSDNMQRVRICYFKNSYVEKELTDDFLSEIETTLFDANKAVRGLAIKLGAIPEDTYPVSSAPPP